MFQLSQRTKSLASVKNAIAEKLILFFIKHPSVRNAANVPLSYFGKMPSLDGATSDRQYAEGEWAYLGDLAEMPRYPLIAGFTRVPQPVESVLDVGCGHGQLIDWVCRDSVQQYVGVDLSKVALEQARLATATQQCLARGIDVRFEVADGMTYSPDRKFDAIVFNEVLYYAADPAAVLNHYQSFLNPNGVLIISMFRSPAALYTWRRCEAKLEMLGEVRLRGGNGFEWDIRLCRPK